MANTARSLYELPARTDKCCVDSIRAAVESFPGEEVLPALSFVLVERALQFARSDGSAGSCSEVKELIAILTSGMIDICTEPGSPLARA